MKAVVVAFNQERALVGTFSVIVQPVVEPIRLLSIRPGPRLQLDYAGNANIILVEIF